MTPPVSTRIVPLLIKLSVEVVIEPPLPASIIPSLLTLPLKMICCPKV
jgi:hypothetical protein